MVSWSTWVISPIARWVSLLARRRRRLMMRTTVTISGVITMENRVSFQL